MKYRIERITEKQPAMCGCCDWYEEEFWQCEVIGKYKNLEDLGVEIVCMNDETCISYKEDLKLLPFNQIKEYYLDPLGIEIEFNTVEYL